MTAASSAVKTNTPRAGARLPRRPLTSPPRRPPPDRLLGASEEGVTSFPCHPPGAPARAAGRDMAWIFDGFEARVNNLGGRCWRQQTGYAPHSHLAGSRGSRLRPFSGAFRPSSAADQPRWTGGAAYAGFASEITSLRPRNATGPCSMRTLIRSCVRCGDYLVNLEDAVVEVKGADDNLTLPNR